MVYTGCPQKKRRVHSSLIYRRILIIYTPNQMVVSKLQNGLINSRIAPRASRLNCQNSEKLSKCIALQCNNQIKVAGKTNDK
jgi:hypothetical protein